MPETVCDNSSTITEISFKYSLLNKICASVLDKPATVSNASKTYMKYLKEMTLVVILKSSTEVGSVRQGDPIAHVVSGF